MQRGTAENTSENEIFGLIAIEMYDSRGNRLSGAYNETTMNGNSSETVIMSMAIPQNAVQVFASFIDCKASHNLYSNEIGKSF